MSVARTQEAVSGTTGGIGTALADAIARVAATPRLLVGVDFDGTLASIASRPELAEISPAAVELLRRAAALPQTEVAIISGRGLESLRSRIGALNGLWLAGGHGAEIAGPWYERRAPEPWGVLEALAAPLLAAAPPSAGFIHERKPHSIAVHYRLVDEAVAARAVSAIIDTIATPAGLSVRPGKMVVELMGAETDKGRALRAIRQRTGATGVIFVGDDVTDEDAFRVLVDGDLGIKVATPRTATAAQHMVGSIEDVHAILARLIDVRSREAPTRGGVPLHHHSILSDQRTIAIVGPDATISWLCVPRIDGPAMFASLLDADRAGCWRVGPAPGDSSAPTQRYIGNSFTLETAWATMRVTDYLDGSGGRSFQRAGRTDLIRVMEGRGLARVEFVPRLDFGRAKLRLGRAEGTPGSLVVEGAADPLVLVAPGIEWSIEELDGTPRAVAMVDLSAAPSGGVVMELRAGTRSTRPAGVEEAHRRAQNERQWSAWAASLVLPRVAPEACRRSALVLRSLVHGPSGAVLAAATTSLPEAIGGVRNWDYRFCWPRDAAIASAALVGLGNTGVAMKFLDWLLGVVDRTAGPERLRPIYTVTGEELGPEAELSHLGGYRASRPVRIGNAAAQQVQLDVFGPIVDLVYRLAEAGAAVSPDQWRLVEAMVLAVERRWHEPDHGIWEVRSEQRHHVHSKAMGWMALDRASRLAHDFLGSRRESWERLRDTIRDEVLQRGYDAGLGGFVSAYDLREPDAATLTLGLAGLIDPGDPRFTGTIDLVMRTLLEGGTVRRYRYDDDLPGPEGGFHLCTGWLIEALTLVGRRREAAELFGALCAGMGPTGIMSEQWCPMERTGLGNLAQAYSHTAVINAAIALSKGA